MNERIRAEIVHLFLGGSSRRKIAQRLGLTRSTVSQVVAEHLQARSEGSLNPELPQKPRKRKSSLDAHSEFIAQMLERFPDITAVRMYEELQGRGFQGKYSIVRTRLKQLRGPAHRRPVVRFETAPGMQAQMDYSTYELDFKRQGRCRVHAFSYILGYSRKQYVHFVESQDFHTTIRQHVEAFSYLGGVAPVCLYDNMKVVVTGYDGEEPIYNTRFLAFSTHYGFRPWACRPRRSQTKGKVERPFLYLEQNLLNGREFESLQNLNDFTVQWLLKSAQRQHGTTQRSPEEMWQEEKPHLRALPAHPYDTAEVVYRVVNAEGSILYRNNAYSVPWQLLGESLPVRISEKELVVYGKDLQECARHELFDRSSLGERRELEAHRRGRNDAVNTELLLERFRSLSAVCEQFFVELVKRRRCGKFEASRILGLLELYRKEDLIKALERAARYGAYALTSVERILALEAQPRTPLEAMAEEGQLQLREILGAQRVQPRELQEYRSLFEDPKEGQQDDPQREDGEEGAQPCLA